MNERLSTSARIHKKTATGVDAYEEAWDFAATIRRQLLIFNLLWFLGFVGGWIILKILTVSAEFGWPGTIFVNVSYWLLFFPIWEMANILKFRFDEKMSMNAAINLVIGRAIYSLILLGAYLCFLLPGIYLHCRLMLHMPLFARNQSALCVEAMCESWRLTRGHVVTLYAFWIVTVLSKPVCAIPFGIGFVLERPLSGFAKSILLASLDDVPQQTAAVY